MSPRVGVSSCLLGQRVRWDGGHKSNDTVIELERYVDLVAVCPEDEVGMGTPREPIKLDPKRRLVGARSGVDHTDSMRSFAEQRSSELADLDGWIFKAGSPSCGLFRVRVQGQGRIGRGTFAEVVTTKRPDLPVVEEHTVDAPFLERVYAHARWRSHTGKLHEFHARHKYQLLAHSQRHYRELGRLVADGGSADDYAKGFFTALALRRTPAKEMNVLQHLAGFLKNDLDAGDLEELAAAIGAHRAGDVPLATPVTLLRHHLRRKPNGWAQSQTFLEPLSL